MSTNLNFGSATSDTYQEFLIKLAEHETDTKCKFVYRRSTKKVLDVQVAISASNARVQWQEKIPYIWLESTLFVCHQGKDVNASKKKKYADNRDLQAENDNVFIKRYNKVQITKKLDCPATINVKRVVLFMNHTLTGEVTKVKKRACSQAVKKAIADGTDLGKECYVYDFPKHEDHQNHLVGQDAEVVEPVDKQIRKFISDLVMEGERNAHVIAELTYAFAENDLHEIDRSRRKFYPDMKTIRRYISATKQKIKKIPIDQDNCLQLLNECQQDTTNSIFVRPYTFPDDEDVTTEGTPTSPSNDDLDICENKIVIEDVIQAASTSSINGEDFGNDCKLRQRGSNKQNLINLINSTYRSIQSVMWNLDESALLQASEVMQNVLHIMTSQVAKDNCNGLPTPVQISHSSCRSNRVNRFGKLMMLHRKRGQNCRMWIASDQLKEVQIIGVSEEGSEAKRVKM